MKKTQMNNKTTTKANNRILQTISILFLNNTLFTIIGIGISICSTNQTFALRTSVITFITDPNNYFRSLVAVTYNTSTITFLTQSPYGNTRLFSTKYKVLKKFQCNETQENIERRRD